MSPVKIHAPVSGTNNGRKVVMTKRKQRWIRWSTVCVTLVAVIGVADVTVRLLVRSGVKSTAAHELLVNDVRKTTLDKASRFIGEVIDDMEWWEAIYVDFNCGSIDAVREQKLREVRRFVNEQARELSIRVLSEPIWGLGWMIDDYRLEARWKRDRLATFGVNYSAKPVNMTHVRASKYEKTLRQKLKRKIC